MCTEDVVTYIVGTTGNKHGKCKHKLYNTWTNMRRRCNTPSTPTFAHYGGRGIQVCKRWDNFEMFLKDMGDRPDGYSLERIDVNGNYEPSNCKWATNQEQAMNKRIKKVKGYVKLITSSGMWRAQYRCEYLGTFNTEKEALNKVIERTKDCPLAIKL